MPEAPLEAVALDLDLAPGLDAYAGVTRLRFGPGDALPDLHVRGPTVRSVRLDGRRVPYTIDGEALRVDRAPGPGPHVLRVAFTGVPGAAPAGIFAFEAEGQRYLATNFEPDDARAAWPCVDRPDAKAPWSLRVTGLHAGQVAVSTMPGERRGGRVTFPPTPPLPAYAFPLMVGPFVGTPVDGLPRPATVWAAAGHEGLAPPVAEALSTAWTTLSRDLPAPPWPKLDVVLIPDLSVGGMENPGAIALSEGAARDWAGPVVQHEVAHLWFGDLVTPRTWEDLWLAEGLTDAVAAWRHGRDDPEGALRASLRADTLAHAQPLRPPADGWRDGDHPPMYAKGARVLHALRERLGDEGALRLLGAWLDAHAGRAADTDDFLALLAPADREVVAPLVFGVGGPRLTLARAPEGVVLTRSAFLRPDQGTRALPAAPTPVALSVSSPGGARRRVEVAVGDAPVTVPLAPGEVPLPLPGAAVWDAAGPLLTELVVDLPDRPFAERGPALAMLGLMVDAGVTPLDEVLAAAPYLPPALDGTAWLALWQRLEAVHDLAPDLVPAVHAALRGPSVRACGGCDAGAGHLDGPGEGSDAAGALAAGEWDRVVALAEAGEPVGDALAAWIASGPAADREAWGAWTWLRAREPGAAARAVAWSLASGTTRARVTRVIEVAPVAGDAQDAVRDALVARWGELAALLTPDERLDLAAVAGRCDPARVDRLRADLGAHLPAGFLDRLGDDARACVVERARLVEAARRLVGARSPAE